MQGHFTQDASGVTEDQTRLIVGNMLAQAGTMPKGLFPMNQAFMLLKVYYAALARKKAGFELPRLPDVKADPDGAIPPA